MSFLGTKKIDDTLTFTVSTHLAATGAATDADAVPAYRVYEDETGTAILTGNMAKLDDANTVGHYSEELTLSAANGFEVGKSYSIYISAAVSSITGTTVRNFGVEADPALASAVAAIPTTAMRGTDSAALASVATEARLAELDGANLPADIAAIPTTAMRGTDSAALASVATEARLAELDAANLPTDIAAIPTTAMRGTDSALLASTFATMFAGITAIAHWIGMLAGKQAADATALTEIKATGAGSGTYDPTAHSLEALRIRGDASWITGGGGGITDILNVHAVIPISIDLANTATVRIGLMLTNAVDDLPSLAEITPGTIDIHRKAIGGTTWSSVVAGAACLEQAGMVYYDEVFDAGSGYAEGDTIRVTFKSQKITVAANDYEITDTNGVMFQTSIRQTMVGTNAAALASVATEARLAELDGANLPADVAAIPTTAMRGTDSAALASVATEARLAELDGANLPADVAAIPTTAMRGTDSAALASVATEARLAELDGANLPTDIAAIPTTAMRGTDSAATAAALATAQLDLDKITGSDGATLATAQGLYAPAKAGDAMALTSAERDAVANALLDLASSIETSVTVRLALRYMASTLFGESTNSGKTFEAAGNPGTDRVAAVVSGLDRTSVALT